jgi:hypothetical protein
VDLYSRRLAGWSIADHMRTEKPEGLTAAYQKAAMALSRGHRLIVITLDDLLKVSTPKQLTDLLVDRLLSRIASGTFQLS